MKSELTFIIFMMLLIATAVLFLWLMTRNKNKQCKNCRFFTLRKDPSAWATALASSTIISSGSQPAKAGSRNKIVRRRNHNIKK